MSSVQPGPANAYASIVPTPALSAGPAFPLQRPLAHDEGFLFFLGTSLIWRSVAEEVHPSADATSSRSSCGKPTGRQGLLELLGLVRVLEDQGVEKPLAADLELDLLGVLVLLDPGGCAKKKPLSEPCCANSSLDRSLRVERTRGVLPPADLDELGQNVSTPSGLAAKPHNRSSTNSHLLDVADFLRHFGWLCRGSCTGLEGTRLKARDVFLEIILCGFPQWGGTPTDAFDGLAGGRGRAGQSFWCGSVTRLVALSL